MGFRGSEVRILSSRPFFNDLARWFFIVREILWHVAFATVSGEAKGVGRSINQIDRLFLCFLSPTFLIFNLKGPIYPSHSCPGKNHRAKAGRP